MSNSLLGLALSTSYLVAVRKALKIRGLSVNSFKNGGPANVAAQTATGGGADGIKVSSEMESVARYFTGGFDYPYDGTKITYSVKVYVSGGNITFKLHCAFSGSYPQNVEKTVMNTANSMIQKRQKMILQRAEDRLNAIQSENDYYISVEVETD